MAGSVQTSKHDDKELAYIYDLYVVPIWREAFDRIVDEEIELPKEGKFLDAGCGTGGYAVDLSLHGSSKVEVIGIDPSDERLALAQGKAEIKKAARVSFQQGSLSKLDFTDKEFDLVIGDVSMLPAEQISDAIDELVRVAKKGATVVIKMTTHGSFGEFFSVYWEALYDLDLIELSPQVEKLITERLTVSDAEALALDAGLSKVRSVTKKERFDFDDGAAFLATPLIESIFLDVWFVALPDQTARQRVQQQLVKIIDRERQQTSFDVSIKATVIIGQK